MLFKADNNLQYETKEQCLLMISKSLQLSTNINQKKKWIQFGWWWLQRQMNLKTMRQNQYFLKALHVFPSHDEIRKNSRNVFLFIKKADQYASQECARITGNIKTKQITFIIYKNGESKFTCRRPYFLFSFYLSHRVYHVSSVLHPHKYLLYSDEHILHKVFGHHKLRVIVYKRHMLFAHKLVLPDYQNYYHNQQHELKIERRKKKRMSRVLA